MGQPWKESFVQTLNEIGEYHFVPILSEKGAAVLPMLMEMKATLGQSTPHLSEWFAQVLDETTHMSRLYPNFLKGMGGGMYLPFQRRRCRCCVVIPHGRLLISCISPSGP